MRMKRMFERHSLVRGNAFSGEAFLHVVEEPKFLLCRSRRVICDVVCSAGEAIKRKHSAAVFGRDQNRGDGEILVLVTLAGLQCMCSVGHALFIAWARPFHIPPRPRQCCRAEAKVKTV